MLAWDSNFVSGTLLIRTPEAADAGVLKVDAATGDILLQGAAGLPFGATGAKITTVTAPIQINVGAINDTTFTIDNNSSGFFDKLTFRYDGGTGLNDTLSIFGRATADDTFSLLQPAGQPREVTVDGTSPAGPVLMRVQFLNLKNELNLNGFGGTDAFEIQGIPGNDQLDVFNDHVEIGTVVVPPVGGDVVNYANFESMEITSLAGNDSIDINSTDIPILLFGGAGDDVVIIEAEGLNADIELRDVAGADGIGVNGTLGGDIFNLTTNTITGNFGGTITYTRNSFDRLVFFGNAGNDTLNVQMPDVFPAPIINEVLPGSILFLGDDLTSSSTDVIKITGTTGLNNNSTGADVINVGDLNSGDDFELFKVECLLVFALAGDDTVNNNSSVNALILGGKGDDTLNGSDTAGEIMIGDDGQDTLIGGDRDDWLFPDYNELGIVFDVRDEDVDGGANTATGGDVAVFGIKPGLFPGDVDDIDNPTGLDDFGDRFAPTIDPAFPTSHLYRVTDALLLLEEAFRQPCAVAAFGSNPFLRGQFATYDAFVGRAYQDYLKRDVTLFEITFWRSESSQFNVPIQEMMARLLESDEYRRATNFLDTQFVRGMIKDTLGRNATSTEMTLYGTQLLNGVSRGAVARQFLASSEVRNSMINGIYNQLFSRAPSTLDRDAILADQDAGVPFSKIALELAAGRGDYYNSVIAARSTEIGFVGALYRDVLKRTGVIPVNELRLFTDQIGAKKLTHDQVINLILNSAEARRVVINDYYVQFLGRPVDQGGLNFFLGQKAAGVRDDEILATIIGSNEFFVPHGGTADTFVRALYSEVLERNTPPTQPELDFWINELAKSTRGPAAARAEIALRFLRTEEYLVIPVTQWYQDFTRRNPSQSELDLAVSRLLGGDTYEQVKFLILRSR